MWHFPPKKKKKNHMWKVVIGSNLNLQLKLLFFPPITTNNNLPLKIYCENIKNITFLIKITSNIKDIKLNFSQNNILHAFNRV